MSQDPQPVIQYETPAVPEKPASILPISIIGISLGGLTLLLRILGLAGAIVTMAMTSRMAGMPNFGSEYQVFQIVSSLIFAAFAALLLTASIGCLRMKEWGRAWLVRYAILYPIALLLEIVASVFVMVPAMTKMMSTVSPGGPPPPARMGSYMAGAMVGSLAIQMVVLLILPVFILVMLRRPEVKAAFQSTQLPTR
jgi:hypothetical protein